MVALLTYRDAMTQELKSMLMFSPALAIILEIAKSLNQDSGMVVILALLVIFAVNTYWEYVDNGGRSERPTFENQMVRK